MTTTLAALHDRMNAACVSAGTAGEHLPAAATGRRPAARAAGAARAVVRRARGAPESVVAPATPPPHAADPALGRSCPVMMDSPFARSRSAVPWPPARHRFQPCSGGSMASRLDNRAAIYDT